MSSEQAYISITFGWKNPAQGMGLGQNPMGMMGFGEMGQNPMGFGGSQGMNAVYPMPMGGQQQGVHTGVYAGGQPGMYAGGQPGMMNNQPPMF